MDHVINSNDEEQDVETATDEEALVMAEKLNDSRILLAGFLKLTMFNVLEARMAAPIWGHFISVSLLDSLFWRADQELVNEQDNIKCIRNRTCTSVVWATK